jgi:hypothetical protein
MRCERGQSSVEYVVVVAAVVAAAAAGSSAVGGLPARLAEAVGGEDRAVVVDRLVDARLETFLAARSSADRDARLDWSTDGCSAPLVGSRGRSFDFHDACLRHDFGYRNHKALGRLDEERRRHVDEVFLADMRASCAARERLRARCRRWAWLFYAAVRRFG